MAKRYPYLAQILRWAPCSDLSSEETQGKKNATQKGKINATETEKPSAENVSKTKKIDGKNVSETKTINSVEIGPESIKDMQDSKLEKLALQIQTSLEQNQTILSKLTQELSVRHTVPKSYVHFLLRPFLGKKDTKDSKYEKIFSNNTPKQGGYTTFVWNKQTKGISGNIGFASSKENKPLPPLNKLEKSLEQFCSPENEKNLVILFYGVSGTGKTYTANKCLSYLEEKNITCTECILFRRPQIFNEDWFTKITQNPNIQIADSEKNKTGIQKALQDLKKKESKEKMFPPTEKLINTEKKSFSDFFKNIVDKKKILATPLNTESSREHTLFVFTTTNKKKCYIFDLAGNEEYDIKELLTFVAMGKVSTTQEIEQQFQEEVKKVATKKGESPNGLEGWIKQKQLKGVQNIYGVAGKATFYAALYVYDVTADADYINKSLLNLKEIWLTAEKKAQGTKLPKTDKSKGKKTKIGNKSQTKSKNGKKKKGKKKEAEAKIPTIEEILQQILFQNQDKIDKHMVITLPQNSPLFKPAIKYIEKSIQFGIELSTIQSKK